MNTDTGNIAVSQELTETGKIDLEAWSPANVISRISPP